MVARGSSALGRCTLANMKTALLTFLFAAMTCSLVHSQDAVPVEILGRTVPLRVVTEQGQMLSQGTSFVIDYAGKSYEITARHVLEGVRADHPENLQIRQGAEWKKLPVTRVLYPSSADVDIAVIETTIPGAKPYEVEVMHDGGSLVFGQSVWFLGYPYLEGLGTKFRGDPATTIPFIKKGILSAIDASNPEAEILSVDGFNNHGFSGGPIVFYDFEKHKYYIAGVVKGYKYDQAETLVQGKSVPTDVLVNSGILVGYSIIHAIDAIKNAPPVK